MLYTVYHGTNNNFDTFDSDKIGSNTESKAFFNFTDNKNVARSYGDRVIKCEIEMNSPITYDCNNQSTIFFNGKYYTPANFAQYIDSINKDLENHYTLDDDVREELEILGFDLLYDDFIDGIILENCKDSFDFGGESATNYIVFKPEQINIIMDEQLAYHGSNATFDKFDLNKFQRGDYGYGIYFTWDKAYAGDYGTVKQYEIPDQNLLLDWDCPVRWDDEMYDKVSDIIDELLEDPKEQELAAKLDEILHRDYCNSGFWIYGTFTEYWDIKRIIKYLREHGIYGTYSENGKCWVVFNPEDIKKVNLEENKMDFQKLNEKLERIINYSLNENEQTILSDEDKEYLTKRFSKMYKEDVVSTLINEVQHLLEVCDWYKSKEFIPIKANGFLFSNKIEWEPCTIEEVQNDVGRKNLLVYLDRVSSGRDSLSTKTLKSRKNSIGTNSVEYKIEFKKDYKRI